MSLSSDSPSLASPPGGAEPVPTQQPIVDSAIETDVTPEEQYQLPLSNLDTTPSSTLKEDDSGILLNGAHSNHNHQNGSVLEDQDQDQESLASVMTISTAESPKDSTLLPLHPDSIQQQKQQEKVLSVSTMSVLNDNTASTESPLPTSTAPVDVLGEASSLTPPSLETTLTTAESIESTTTESSPVKRGPGRPTRLELLAKALNNPVPVMDRPRRTPRAVTTSPTIGTSVSADSSPGAAGSSIHHESSNKAAIDALSLADGPAKAAGQRASSRQMRTPVRLAFEPSPTANNATRATPANQRPLLGQNPMTNLTLIKRGPGRPAGSSSSPQHHRQTAARLPSPPPIVPLKRGPGRPPRNPLTPKPTPQVSTAAATFAAKSKAKSASPTMVRGSGGKLLSASASPSPRSANTVISEPATPIKRGPGRPPWKYLENNRDNSTSSGSTSSSRNNASQSHTPQPSQQTTSTSRSRKRYIKSEDEDDEASENAEGSGVIPRKKRVVSAATTSSVPARSRVAAAIVELPKPVLPPKPLTPLDIARNEKVAEWEGKLHGVIDHHDSLARELYHLETFTSMLTYDPVKIKSDHSERMLRFLRSFDLWSQVPDVVSNVQLNTDRISTRRSAIEHREQLVDLLQKNVESALPKRPEGASLSTSLIRVGPLRGAQPQFSSFEEYMDSFVYADDEEVTQQEADKRAASHAQILSRIDALKAEGRLSGKPNKPFIDPEVPKLQSHWLMEHIMTSSRLIKQEGTLQMARARKVSKMITRHFEQLHGKSEREQRLEEKRIQKLAKLTSNEVKKKWRYVEGIVKARHKALLQAEQEEAGKRHLNLILEHSTQILEVQQSTLNMGAAGAPGTPRTPDTPSTPATGPDVTAMSDVQSEPPSTPSHTGRSSRRSSVARSVASASDAELDVGDTEFNLNDAEVDDETTLANEESGSEEDEAEISGLNAEMDIPIEELLRQYGYQLSGGEESDSDDDDHDESSQKVSVTKNPNHKHEVEPSKSRPSPSERNARIRAAANIANTASPKAGEEQDVEMEEPEVTLKDAISDVDGDKTMKDESSTTSTNDTSNLLSNTDTQTNELQSTITTKSYDVESRRMSSKEIADALPDSIKTVSQPTAFAERGPVTKRRRLSLNDLYRGAPLPYNPYGEQDDERTIDEDEAEETSDPEELPTLLLEKDLPIEELLDRYNYEDDSSDQSDSFYGSDSDDDNMSIMSSQQRIKRADPRYVVTLQDVAVHSRKFPTRPSSEFTDTDEEYDDSRTVSDYGTDDELGLGDKLPLLDPLPPPKSPEPETFTTGANVNTKVPFLLRHQLREYQHVGMDWLANLYSNGLNGILADEMGLGKTMQTIALLAHLACDHGVWGPHLIVVPTSVMLNWEMEFKKWCPGFKIMTYYGSPRERKEKRVGWSREHSFHVCITSYQLVVQDQSVFRRKAWQYLILDEAHNIKNFRSQRWQTLLNFNSARRLLLTGTPLQNNLMELWSLLYFLMPNGVSQTMPVGFANQKEFQEWFSHPVDRMIEGNEQQDEDSKAAIARLHTVLRPYLLRRLKADVETQMPAKYEHVVYCRLSKRQRFLYDDFMSRAKTRETLASGNFLSIINCLMQLRKVCNHPDLFEVRPIVTSFAMPSAVASFEVTEFLVRRKIFAEVDRARESVNMEFLGLILTRFEDKISKSDMEAFKSHDSTASFQQRAAAFAQPQSKTLSSSNHYQDVRQYSSMRRHRFMQESKARWEQLGYVNSNRCNVEVMYGSSLLQLCQSPSRTRTGCATVLDQVTDPRQFLNYTDALARAVVPSETRFYEEEETIKRFAFVTPSVLVRDPSWIPLEINLSPPTLEVVCNRAKELLHPIENRLQVQFPDKRLLQFDCGKLQKLDSLLRELKSGGHRALIFTQMTKVLDILEIFLNIHGHRYLRLDGATKVENRQHLTDRFNSDPKILAFILSTRSGGVGINLTGADTVIFYDSDWNPSMDRQCQDRCHRIGQTRDVHIYRFVSEFTIEENMLKKANQKRMLDNVVIQEGSFTTEYFQKMDWRDMLGEDDLAKIGDLGPVTDAGTPQDLSTVQGTDLEEALAAAEDESDVLAMHQAKHEIEGVDVGDFSDAPAAPAAGATSTATAGAAGSTSVTKSSSGPRVQFAGADSNEQEYDEVIELGHVDEYMLRFMEAEYGHYVGFGGLPKPVKPETVDDLEMEDHMLTRELSEEEEEDDEEEEESDEYDDIEDSGSEAEKGRDQNDEENSSDDEDGKEDEGESNNSQAMEED
ncbi:swr1 complex component [Gryganskiella cystojenkinii]|nr:swr1 complex component [Gryganskiella cystojenkinii]